MDFTDASLQHWVQFVITGILYLSYWNYQTTEISSQKTTESLLKLSQFWHWYIREFDGMIQLKSSFLQSQ